MWLIYLIIAAMLSAATTFADDLIDELGLTLPIPLYDFNDSLSLDRILNLGGLPAEIWLLPTDAIPPVLSPTKYELLLTLSDSGTVDSLQIAPPAGNGALAYFRKSLLALKFRPAAIDGKNTAYRLPAELLLGEEKFLNISPRRRRSAILALPAINRATTFRRDLVEKSFSLNGIEMPRVKYFPSYFCFFKIGERSAKYSFAVYRISLDSAGHLLDFSEFCSSRAECAEYFGRALLHAEFMPGKIDGQSRPSEFYLTVRFFDQLQYPTRKWYYDSTVKDNSIYENFRLESSLSVDSVINPPLPLGTTSGLVPFNSPIRFVDTLRAYVKIDTLGKITTASFGTPENRNLDTLGMEVLSRLEFIPARDLLDRKVDFRGELFLRFDGSNISRIRFEWLPRRAQPVFY